MTLLRIYQASCFLSFNFFLSQDTTSCHINTKIVGIARQSAADTVPQSATMDHYLLLDYNMKPVLSSCSENHCGKCALILLSLIWMTEKGMTSLGVMIHGYTGTTYRYIMVPMRKLFNTIQSGALLVMIRWFYILYLFIFIPLRCLEISECVLSK